MMSPTVAAAVGIAFMLLLMLLEMPVAFAMLLAGFLGSMYVLSPQAAFHLLASDIWGNFASYSLSVVPLFVLMGNLAFRSGITDRLYQAAYKWVGHWPGGVAGTTILASAGFASICGSNSATTATMGTIALPEMRKYNYDRTLSGGAVAVGGTLGVVIPPSVVLIVIAVQTEQSIAKLFLASILPGLLLTSLLLLTVLTLCWFRPHLGPAGPRTPLLDKLKALAGVTEAVLLFLVVIGGLYAGWFTPTEAGAAGAFGALVIALVRRRLTWSAFQSAVLDTLRVSSMVVLLIAGAVVFGRFLTVTRLPFELAEWASGLPIPPAVVLSIILLIYVIGGCIMDALGFLVVTVPIFFPVGIALGYDPIWFTIMITVVTTLGAITPPVGVNVYIVSGLSPDIPIHAIFKGISLFLLAYILSIVLMMVFPDIILAVPKLMS